jgi:hypothetical protein
MIMPIGSKTRRKYIYADWPRIMFSDVTGKDPFGDINVLPVECWHEQLTPDLSTDAPNPYRSSGASSRLASQSDTFS